MQYLNRVGLLPNFLIIGAMKAGTTSLHYYLNQHPEIFMCPRTEPRFFSFEGEKLFFCGPGDKLINKQAITSLAAYKKLFCGVQKEKAIGEKSPSYLHMPKAAERIKHHIPNAKLIAVLRNPIDRAFSAFLMHTRNGNEKLSFERALELEEYRLKNNWSWGWGYMHLGFYAKHLDPYLTLFDQSKILILLYDDFLVSPQATLNKIFRFLEVNEDYLPNMNYKHNISGMPSVRILHRSLFNLKNSIRFMQPYAPRLMKDVLRNIQRRGLYKPNLNHETRKKLRCVFEKDILELEKIIKRDLSIWLKD